jgi:hypothetical protein
VRAYYPGLPAANARTSGLAGANKSAVIVSFKAQPQTVLSGADDAALAHFFTTAPTGHPIYWSYWHEPENDAAHGRVHPGPNTGPRGRTSPGSRAPRTTRTCAPR